MNRWSRIEVIVAHLPWISAFVIQAPVEHGNDIILYRREALFEVFDYVGNVLDSHRHPN